ncbi:hypothetical protein [Lacrimispora xylanolytica]|uniref:Uncharacterized protein n=1 Tax=Lacrimispora xylanolytica TaxID=29375 RepID=A0ABY7AC10_9FIRM|nr:hypothetical protein [Lacrimispora xylanolytica]WAJ24032.1 hypothetical protein OW255_00440 [Lacrimispora xylanolytica]
MTETGINEYRSLLGTLKRNKENIPLQQLKTEYQKGYDQLTQRIQSMTREVILDVIIEGLRIERPQADKWYMEINSATRESGYMKKASQAAFLQQDADLVLEYANKLREIVHSTVKGCEKNAG